MKDLKRKKEHRKYNKNKAKRRKNRPANKIAKIRK